ncbi:MAG: PQQ-binding-like beta-propeller repeat protein [Candidatus Bathyarchaeales archaeon]
MKRTNKVAAAIAVVLLLAAASFAVLVSKAQLQLGEVPTFLYVSVAPNPVGVGQTVYVNAFFSKPPLTAGLAGTGDMYTGVTIEVTKPDGTKQTLGPYKSDPTGGMWDTFVPSTTGQYKFKAIYPGQYINGSMSGLFGPPTRVELTYKPSTSAEVTLTVQSDPVGMNYKTPPLPTEYWFRPIYATNWDWAQLGGSWYGLRAASFATTGMYDAMGNFQPYSTAPNAPHILWTKPTHFGGQPGLPIPNDQMSQYMSTTIATNFFEPIVLHGILYYTHFAGPTAQKPEWVAVDLRTGETLWTRTAGRSGNEVFRMGQILRFHGMQEYGSWAFLYSTESAAFFGTPTFFNVWDPMTGAFLFNITGIQNVPFMISLEGECPGTLLAYYTSGGNLVLWNSTKLMMSASTDRITIRPSGSYNWSAGIEWQKPIPTTVGGQPIGGSLSIAARTPEVILLTYNPTPGMFISLNLGYMIAAGFDAKTGALLWGPKNMTMPRYEDMSILAARDGVFVMHNKDKNEAYGYSLENGNLLWGPVKLPGNAWSCISVAAEIAYGNVYIWDFGGYVNALDLKTGKIKWTFEPRSSGYDAPTPMYPLWVFGSGTICDGKLFFSEGSMYNPPLHPAYRLAINATTGELIWKILSYSGRCPAAHADGMMVQWNSFDSQIYCFGKGPTAVTVQATPEISVHGSKVLVKGMVTDESPGTKNYNIRARFPNGVPAIADEYMSEWMEYVYMQQIKPTNIKGVEVTITVLDPNGNCYDVAKTTSDASGFYSATFEPPVPGKYTVIATFAGSESYYGSSAETAIYVEEAPAPAAPEATPTPASMAETYILGFGIAILVVVIIGFALLLLKKK